MRTPDLSRLPGIDTLLDSASDLRDAYGRDSVVAALRTVIDQVRRGLLEGTSSEVPPSGVLLEEAAFLLASHRPAPLRRVINATGIVVHTNLGRAPLGASAIDALMETTGSCDLEYELDSGRRGSRGSRIDPLIAQACGAADGMAVNNAAGALVLALASLAGGRGVAVSRGELVEIGGEFRIPDILSASGASLVEVGTTNRTRASDYAAALASSDVALVLKVHPSNYRITGFTESVGVRELAAIAAACALPLLYDCGSGLLEARPEAWLAHEPSMRSALAEGADVVIASGDKLLGGPQAGLLAGRGDLVDACRRHPLARALRLDKLRIAALAATLEAHLRGTAADDVPVWTMLSANPVLLGQRASRLAEALGAKMVDGTGRVGGGAAPEASVPGPVVRLETPRPEAVARALRAGEPPLIARVEDGSVWLDPRTYPPSDDDLVAALVTMAVRAAGDRR